MWVLTSGTDSGVMKFTGEVMHGCKEVPCIGFAAVQRVANFHGTWPPRHSRHSTEVATQGDLISLEEHHTHFVLVNNPS